MLELVTQTHIAIPRTLSRDQVADMLGVKPKTLMAHRDKLPYIETARGCVMYTAGQVQDYLLRSMKGGWAVAKIDTLRELERARIRVAELEAKTKELEFQLEIVRRAG